MPVQRHCTSSLARLCLLVLASLFAAVGCELAPPPTGYQTLPPTQANQQRYTPDSVLDRLLEGNSRFVEGRALSRNTTAAISLSSKGQYPLAVVLACMDSRVAPELVFDQGLGEIFVARVAGNYATPDILGSMEYAANVAGAKLVLVMGHSTCGAIKGTADNVQLGNISTVVNAIKPAIEDVPHSAGHADSHNPVFVQALAEANVRRTVAKIRTDSPVLASLEKEGKIKIVGAMYDLTTGRVTLLKDTAPTAH
jgi:carbonic anhydrase